MNQPDRYELFVLPDGMKKITIQKDSKIPNAAKFIIQKEDHTLGNILKDRVAKQPNVTFSGYRVPHPLEPCFELVVHTNKNTNPKSAVASALNDQIADLSILEDRFKMEILRAQQESDANQMGTAASHFGSAQSDNRPYR